LVKQVEKIKDYLSTIVQQSNDAIYIHNDHGQLISWNDGAERIYGYTETEALRMKIWNIIPEYLHEETQKTIGRIIEGQGLQFLETKRITKHGKLVDVFFSAAVIVDPENGKKSVAITERDITHQKLAEEQILQLNANLKMNVLQLEGTNKELESFSYSVSHDLRAPLRAISGYTKILEEDYIEKLDDKAKRALTIVQENVLRMNNLIDDLLEFSKMGKREVNKGEVSMSQLVSGLIEEAKSSASSKA
jgi:PAS domain S-box-containing protein